MKNSKGETLPQPYLALAEMRRAQLINSIWAIKNLEDFKKSQKLDDAFCWSDTPERFIFWINVDRNENPAIPAASLAELEAWEKQRGVYDAVGITSIPTEPDYKAMYSELLEKHAELIIQNTELRTAATPTRNWVAECAMRLYGYGMATELSWERAEKWAAEGKKRGHI